MTTLMRNGRDRRLGIPLTCAMRDLNACDWLGPDQRIASGSAATAAAFKGRIHGRSRCRHIYSCLSCDLKKSHKRDHETSSESNGGLDYVKQDCDLDEGHAAPRDQLKCQVDKPNQECCPAGREGKQSQNKAGGKNVLGHVKTESQSGVAKTGELFLVFSSPRSTEALRQNQTDVRSFR